MKIKIKTKRGDQHVDVYTKYGLFEIKWAAPGTIWYIRRQTPKGYRIRIDNLFGFSRTFMRELREYVYALNVGRLGISWWHYPKEKR